MNRCLPEVWRWRILSIRLLSLILTLQEVRESSITLFKCVRIVPQGQQWSVDRNDDKASRLGRSNFLGNGY
ncbi:hypothetical protein KPHVMX_100098 [Klebsiella pneumoniae]|nr:hypothetical protein KPHVMX_100098 [Klebsiella pneumoniae]